METEGHHSPATELLWVELVTPEKDERVWTGETHNGLRHRVRKVSIKAPKGETEVWEEHEVYWSTKHKRVKEEVTI